MFRIEIRPHRPDFQTADCAGALIKFNSGHRIFAFCSAHHLAHLRHMAGHHLAIFLFLHHAGAPDQLFLAIIDFQDDVVLQRLPADDRYRILVPTPRLSKNCLNFICVASYFFRTPFADIFREVAVHQLHAEPAEQPDDDARKKQEGKEQVPTDRTPHRFPPNR